MSTPSIEVRELGKRYLITQREEADTLAGTVARLFRLRPRARRRSEFWALRSISLEVHPGEVLGIVGRNGAGKSTLLKILGGITDPTEGQGIVRGRVGLLLEVGTGFHPELSGRDNIYLNGAILGMSRGQINLRYEEIVDFAEIAQFIDVPVKRYSSGMYVRLAFAVAAHLEPDILIVDEVLAVGDAAFQKKCLGKMDQVAGEGRTVIFISHNMGSIERLCTRCVLLDHGRIVSEGAPRDVIARYIGLEEPTKLRWARPREASASEFAFTSVTIPAEGETGIFGGDEPVPVEIAYAVAEPLRACQISVQVVSSDGAAVFATSDCDVELVSAIPRDPGEYRATFSLPAHLLAPGRYSLSLAAHDPMRRMYDLHEHVLTFEVSQRGSLVELDNRHGLVAPMLEWRRERVGGGVIAR